MNPGSAKSNILGSTLIFGTNPVWSTSGCPFDINLGTHESEEDTGIISYGLWIGSDEDAYVIDRRTSRVQYFDIHGKFP